jgi:hypothetical protein
METAVSATLPANPAEAGQRYGRGLLWSSAGMFIVSVAAVLLFLVGLEAATPFHWDGPYATAFLVVFTALMVLSAICTARGGALRKSAPELLVRSRSNLLRRAASAEAQVLGATLVAFVAIALLAWGPRSPGAYGLFLILAMVPPAAGFIGEYRSRWWEKSAPLAI